MIYSEPLINQISCFISSIGFGFILCFLYIAVKISFRVIGKGKLTVMLSDGVFVLSLTLLSFFFMITQNSGQVRLNLVLGQLIGGLVIYFTAGRYLLKLLYPLCDMLNLILKKLLYPVRVYFKAFANAASSVFSKVKGINWRKKQKKEENKKKKIKLLQKSS